MFSAKEYISNWEKDSEKAHKKEMNELKRESREYGNRDYIKRKDFKGKNWKRWK